MRRPQMDIAKLESRYDDDGEIHRKEDNLDVNDDNDYNDLMNDDGFGSDFSSPMESKKDLLMSLTNFDPAIRQRVHNWSGDIKTEEGKWIRHANEPIMNDKGINCALNIITRYAQGHSYLTHIGSPEYKYHMKMCCLNFWNLFPSNIEDFGIKSNQHLETVALDIEQMASLILLGAGNGGYKNFFEGTARFAYNHSDGVNNYGSSMGGLNMPGSVASQTLDKERKSWFNTLKFW